MGDKPRLNLLPRTTGGFAFDGIIAALWRQGLDTNAISKAARIRESDVANRLATLRDEGLL